MRREKLKDMYTGFCKEYPIVTIEDPFDQDDWDATAAFTAEGVCQVRTMNLAPTSVDKLGHPDCLPASSHLRS